MTYQTSSQTQSPVRLPMLYLTFLFLLHACVSFSAEPTFVGKLAFAVEPGIAAKLQLSDEVRTKLNEVILDREDMALELSLEIKDLPPAERRAKLAPFVAESEKQGLALFNDEQKAIIEKVSLSRRGLRAMADESVATALDLQDAQKEQFAKIVAEYDQQMGTLAPARHALLKSVFEARYAKILTAEQTAKWDELAGTEEGSDVANATDPGPNVPRPNPNPPSDTTKRPPIGNAPVVLPGADVKLKFTFEYQPWKDVLEWFAQQAGLSLVMEAPPAGTFKYLDNREYSVPQAMDLMNSVLLTKGYTLVRRERMLLLINLEDGIPPNLVTRISVTDLDSRGEYELVSCLFQLTKVTPEQIEREIKELLGPQGKVVVLPSAKQIFVLETAGNLRTIRSVIESAENPVGVDTVPELAKTIELKHVGPDELMPIVRQLLGIPPDQNAMPDGSLKIAFEPLSMRLYLSGKPEMTKRFEDVLKLIDVPTGLDLPTEIETPQLEVYSITDADPESVLSVMQTMMAGQPDVRLAIDPTTQNLIAMARPKQHATIKATLDQLQKDSSEIEVIQLRRVDPSVAVLAINRLFGIDAEDAGSKHGLKVDADPTTSQLLVRGSKYQIEEIRKLLVKMGEDDGDAADGSRGNVRILPYTGRTAQSVLDQVQELWPSLGKNRIRVVTPSAISPSLRQIGPAPEEKEETEPEKTSPLIPSFEQLFPKLPAGPPVGPAVGPAVGPSTNKAGTEDSTPKKNATETPATEKKPAANTDANKEARHLREAPQSPFRFVAHFQPPAAGQPAAPTSPADEEPDASPAENKSVPGSEIIISLGPGGIVIASQDLDALDAFENLILSIADQAAASPAEPTIFYLRYAKADMAASLVNEILGTGGGDAGGGGSLFGDIASSALGGVGGDLLGGLFGLGGDGGGALSTAGSVSIVADQRLNALFVQASAQDLELVEQLLRVIDQKYSPEEVQTIPAPRLIPVINNDAENISQVVQKVYSDRLVASGGQGNRQPNPQEILQALRGGRNGQGGGQQKEDDSQKLRIGVDARSNSLVVSAPDPLFKEVQNLVQKLDNANVDSDESFTVLPIRVANPELIQRALKSILGEDNVRSTSQNGNSAQRSPTGGGNTQQIQQQIEQFRSLQQQFQNRGGGSTRPGGGGGTPGGGTQGGGTQGGGRGPGGRSGGR